MSLSLKDQLNTTLLLQISERLQKAWPQWQHQEFWEACQGFEALELKERAELWADAMAQCLPQNFGDAAKILIHSMGPKLEKTEGNGMAPFAYMPYGIFVEKHGTQDFDAAMEVLYEMTQRFTAEFSLRVFWLTRTEETFERMQQWALDPSEHVRRAVSESCRPRLPWAARLPAFIKDPSKVLYLLELLKNDSSEYVRRSVANCLNDIGKDHPQLLLDTAGRWLNPSLQKGPSSQKNRQRLIRHALRSLIKAGHPEALKILGYSGTPTAVHISNSNLEPLCPRLGDSISIGFDLQNTGEEAQEFMVDFRIHFVKANGSSSAKVFKLKALELKAGQKVHLQKKVSLADLTTRRHYPGSHIVEAQVNGSLWELGSFELLS
jgi:3-methyladenine DNA glycosylase AlkC